MRAYRTSKVVLWLLLSLGSASGASAARVCEALFSPPRQTLTALKAAEKKNSAGVIPPRFANPLKEIMASRTWNGVKAPQLLQAMLPADVTLIDHSLVRANEESVVKTSAGNMVHLRAKLDEKTGTNIGVNLGALKDNMNRDVKSFVRENSDAAVVFVHGGGTNSTGHHVAASMMSWFSAFNVDVVSMDMPWHAEGATKSYESQKAMVEELRAYLIKYVAPAGKPIFLAGHSMGGRIVDLYMRLYPNDNLIAGVIPLSTVADAMPGGTTEQKLLQEMMIEEKNKTNENIPQAERDMGENLARQNKLSPTCGMFCDLLMFDINWDMPAHKGKDYLPALYIIGEGDGLYQGFEQAFAEGVAALPKAQLRVLGPRRNLKDTEGKFNITGHLIFEHFPLVDIASDLSEDIRQSILKATISEANFNQLRAEGKVVMDPQFTFADLAQPETFVLMRNFIRQVSGKPLAKTEFVTTPLELVTQAYTNNLAFREFAKSFIYMNMKPSEKVALLGQELQSLRELTAPLKKSKDPADKAEFARLNERYVQLLEIKNNGGELSGERLEKYKALREQVMTITAQVSPLEAERKKIASALEKNKKALESAEKQLAAVEKDLSSPRLDQVRARKEGSFKAMMDLNQKIREAGREYLLASYKNGKFAPNLFENLPAPIVTDFEKYERLSNLYKKALNQYGQTLIVEAEASHLVFTGKPDKKAEVESNVILTAQKAQALSVEIPLLLKRVGEIDQQLTDFANQSFRLEKEMAEVSGYDYYTPEFVTVQNILIQDVGALSDKKTYDETMRMLTKIYAEWQKIWSVRLAGATEIPE